ncbi:hypothetical protein EJ110_NYTH38424 [Nymphaea thermarum]|nr:hypothetical protein EJ110_NYTH38424 [Nymphaea thermarum]
MGQFSYHRLTPEGEDLLDVSEFPWRSASRSWTRSSGRFQFRRRRSRLRVPSLGRFFKRRRSFLAAFRASCRKVVKRLVEGRAHFGELFAGNYMFMQVTAGAPSMGYCLDKQFMAQHCSKYLPSKIAA